MNTSGLKQLCNNPQPTYEALTLEFLSSLSYITPPGATQFLTRADAFRMFGTEYSLNQTQIARILGFRHGDGVHCCIPNGWSEIEFGMWHSLTNVNVTSLDALNATYIHNPAIRYFHRVLGHTVFGRVNNHKVNSKELFFLHCVFTPVAFNATPFLLAKIQATCMRGNTEFCFGGIITSIALGLNLGDRLANLPALPTEFLNIDYCHSSHLIKIRDDGRYHPGVRNKIVHYIIMPNRNRIDPYNMANWIFNLNAPEPNKEDPNDNGADEVEEELDRQVPQPPPEHAAETSS